MRMVGFDVLLGTSDEMNEEKIHRASAVKKGINAFLRNYSLMTHMRLLFCCLSIVQEYLVDPSTQLVECLCEKT